MKIPVEGFTDYDENDPDIKFRKNRWDYWSMLKKVREEYVSTVEIVAGIFDIYDFGDFVEQNYGIKISIVDGRITDKFAIVDEKLYTYFVLKHS
jgi:hypothetical protein